MPKLTDCVSILRRVARFSTQPFMRILISGGGGFLGSHLTDLLLKQGHEVVALDNFITGRPQNIAHLDGHDRYSIFEHDVTEPIGDDLAARIGKIDRLYHMASPASPIGYVKHQVATMKVNSEGTWNLLEFAQKHGTDACGEKGARFLMASTSECYGDPAVHPQPESYWGNVNPVGMRSMYDEAKRFSEACCMAYHRERGADTRLIRIFNTYGPRMDPTDGRVVINFIRQALNNEPLTVYGDGQQTRSLCYVSDLVRGINMVMESEPAHENDEAVHLPVNLGNPDELTILDIAREVRDLIPESTSPIKHLPMPPDDPKLRQPDISRARETIGWTPTVNRRDGLKTMVDFYRDQLMAESAELPRAIAV